MTEIRRHNMIRAQNGPPAAHAHRATDEHQTQTRARISRGRTMCARYRRTRIRQAVTTVPGGPPRDHRHAHPGPRKAQTIARRMGRK